MVTIIFEGLKIGVIIQMINKCYPRDALYGIVFSVISIFKLYHLCLSSKRWRLICFYVYLLQLVPQKTLGAHQIGWRNLARGLKILKNVWTRWIPMLAPFKWMLNEYKFFVIKMFDDLAINSVVATNYEPLCDVKFLMGLTYIYVANVGGHTKFEQTCSK